MSKNYMEEVARMLGVEPSLTLKVIGIPEEGGLFCVQSRGKSVPGGRKGLCTRGHRLYRMQVE